ncbi:MAG: phosphoenolpyruvate carboxykinase (ATP), partial [Candidatus Aenigmarchaeota archaeon]|nr:phosphoenolpyruvate carboxykinase (ATP) [Candidatus Aenigmarchaeota archaeon]
MNLENELNNLLEKHGNVIKNPDREKLIEDVVKNDEALISKNGALSIRTPPESTGRSPKDTYIVKRSETEKNIDWDSPSSIPIDPETFDMLLKDALHVLGKKKSIYVTDRSVGADVSYAVTVKTVTDRALTSLFTCTMFRDIPKGIEKSIFSNRKFTIIVLPYEKVNADKYTGKLRVSEKTKKTSDMAIVMDFDKNIGLVYGSAYCGTVKKLMFTCMNYILPEKGILPLHCSANEGERGDIALFLGLSGTGKTTLSADPNRALLGDDEHGWSDDGIANFEYGCYAKLINLDPEKEPEI